MEDIFDVLAADPSGEFERYSHTQIFEIGQMDGFSSESYVNFYDVFVRNAFANFGDILREVTYSPVIGESPTYKGNLAFDYRNYYPDENYASGNMQLLSIGKFRLNSDGT